MSDSYAARLKDYPNKGVCGLPELRDTARSLNRKVDTLVDLVEQSKGRIVVLTGAGISTSAGIPDFRGPQGVWTLEKQQQEENNNSKNNSNKMNNNNSKNKERKRQREPVTKIDFVNAKPTYTHRAIAKLVRSGIVRYVVTQNVDGLHRRSGLSRDDHAVLHGCVFTEKCDDPKCGAEHFRDYDVGGMSFQLTGRRCELCSRKSGNDDDGCNSATDGGGALRDTLLDWEDPLPEDDFERSTIECENADLVLCLGTSLRIEPAGSLPLKAKKFVVVNLQETAKNKHATLIIRSHVDEIMRILMERLQLNCDSSDDYPSVERIWKPGTNSNNQKNGDDNNIASSSSSKQQRRCTTTTQQDSTSTSSTTKSNTEDEEEP